MKITLTIVFIVACFTLNAQDINKNFERWTIGDKPINFTGIDVSPDGVNVALVSGRSKIVMIYDYKAKTIVKEIKIESDNLGYNVYYSALGHFLLIQERTIAKSIKKGRKADYFVVDIASGKAIHKFNKISDAEISHDEKYVVTLENSVVTYIDIKTGKKVREFESEDAMNAIALSPDGKDIAIVKKPAKSEIKMLASKNVSKKAIKEAAKTKHLVTVYDTESFELKTLIPEFYDNINLLFYKDNGNKLLSLNLANNTYVNVAMPKEGYKPTREGYISRTSVQPDFSYSKNSEYFGIATMEIFPSVNIYDVETATVVDKYDTKMKIWKNMKKGIYAGTNTSFVFLPGDKYVIIAYGNSLIKWKYKKD